MLEIFFVSINFPAIQMESNLEKSLNKYLIKMMTRKKFFSVFEENIQQSFQEAFFLHT